MEEFHFICTRPLNAASEGPFHSKTKSIDRAGLECGSIVVAFTVSSVKLLLDCVCSCVYICVMCVCVK